jgi:molybdopterin converting factor small subunit
MDDTTSVRIRVKGVSTLREVIRNDMIITLRSGSTMGDLINRLEDEIGPKYKQITGEGLSHVIQRLFTATINGKLPTPIRSIDSVLRDGDEIVFFQWTGA